MIEFAVLLTLGKMPAGIEVEIVVMFKVGKGRPEKGKFGMLVGTRLPGSGYPKLDVETVESETLWLATGKGNTMTVVVSVVVPLVIVVVPRVSKSKPLIVLVCASR